MQLYSYERTFTVIWYVLIILFVYIICNQDSQKSNIDSEWIILVK